MPLDPRSSESQPAAPAGGSASDPVPGRAPEDGRDPLEMRSSPRVGTDFPAQVHTSEWRGGLAARARDLSVGGACLATASPFAIKSIEQVVIDLPDGPVAVPAAGRWQREEPADDVVLTGVEFTERSSELNERIWRQVIDAGFELARFLLERSDLHELGVEDAMGLAQVTRSRSIPVGRAIYRQGSCEPGEDSLFLVAEGEVVLQLRVRDAFERETARLGPGELFGGLPLVSGEAQAESAIAARECRLLEIDRAAWRYLRTARPWLGQRLGQALLRVTAVRFHALLERLARDL